MFKEREQSMEAKFARDGELAFQVRIQAFRFLAGWAALLKDETPQEALALERALIREVLRHPGDARAIAFLGEYLGDLADDALLRSKLAEFTRDAGAVGQFGKAS